MAIFQVTLWYAVPLIIVVSLVYGATRDERMEPILQHAIRAGIWICGFMLVILAILIIVSMMV